MPEHAQDDSNTSVAHLRQIVRDFVDARHWRKFHAPKNLSMALAIEAAELMEHFQWMDVEPSRQIAEDPEALHEVGEELADVICYALAIANALDLDVAQAVRNKMLKNAVKYPASEHDTSSDL